MQGVLEAFEEDEGAGASLIGTFEDTGWTPPRGGLSWEAYAALVSAQRRRRRNTERQLSVELWRLADILGWGLFEFGEAFYQLFEGVHYEKESLARIAAVGEAFERSRRRDPARVTFWTHYEVYTLDPEDADNLLSRFENGELRRGDLRAEAELLRNGGTSLGSSGSSGAGDDDAQGKLLDTCPLCDGVGEVTPDQRAAYLHEEGVHHGSI